MSNRPDPASGAGTSDLTEAVVEPRPGVVPLLRSERQVILLVDLGRRSVEAANFTAGMIWATCDGLLTVGAVTGEVAKLFDADGETIAGDVAASVDEFRRRLLLRTPDDPPFRSMIPTLAPGPAGTSYAVPVPCRCGTDLDAVEWSGTLAAQVGSVRLGIRYDTRSTGERLQAVLEPRLVDDPGAPALFSVVLLDDGDSGDGPSRRSGRRSGLYEGQRWQNIGPDHDAIIEAVVHRVEGWTPLLPTEVRLDVLGIDGPNGIALAPAHHGLEPRLEELAGRHGWSFLEPPIVLDAECGTVAEHPVRALVWAGEHTSRADQDEALSRLVRAAEPRPSDDLERFVENLDHLAASVPTVVTPAGELADVVRALVRAR